MLPKLSSIEPRTERAVERKGTGYKGKEGADGRQHSDVRTSSGERRESHESDSKPRGSKTARRDGPPAKTHLLQGELICLHALIQTFCSY